jgi:alpha-D-ribose 1-methylphosphonate 5-triphosphate synthase subunit PhnH
MSEALEAGFADPVLGAQTTFRAVMDALARPGIAQPIAFPSIPPMPLTAELAAVALTLLDHDTAVWLDPALMEADAVCSWLAFHTGAPVTTEPADAGFALVTEAALLPALDRFAQGTDEYPDRSTTIVLAVPALEGGPALRLRGPGIRDSAVIAPVGLPVDFIAQRGENRARFPRGVDLLLTAPGLVLGLPRTTRVEG